MMEILNFSKEYLASTIVKVAPLKEKFDFFHDF